MSETEIVKCPNCDAEVFSILRTEEQGIELIIIRCLACSKYHPLIQMEEKE